MYSTLSEISEEQMTAKQEDLGTALDIYCGSIFVRIHKEDIIKSPTAGAFIVAYIQSVLQEAGQ